VMPSPKWLVRLPGRLANRHLFVRHGRIASKSFARTNGLKPLANLASRTRRNVTFHHAFNRTAKTQ
jgi:hypothetical protein